MVTNDLILHKPLKKINSVEELVELFYALPEKHVEKIYIIRKLEQMCADAIGPSKKNIEKSLQQLQPVKIEKDILTALQVPWGDWSCIYRVRGLYRAINFIETQLNQKDVNPNLTLQRDLV